MKPLDVVLVLLLVICAIRGLWRGFFRECSGFLGLVGGLVSALRFADEGAAELARYVELPGAAGNAVAFIGIFMVVSTLMNLVGLLLSHAAGGAGLRVVNRAAGLAFAVGKGGVILAFVLFFFHLFPVVPSLDEHLRESRIAPPLISLAGNVIGVGLRDAGARGKPGGV
ncbi:MAG: hypothetical protein A3J75_04155 [Acidobacteria bacterium RBG_16_68_9]|nr:MAG: hypothetical protein A3J75_04155 [Acidobacteria bacterium RBG_16_68_9]